MRIFILSLVLSSILVIPVAMVQALDSTSTGTTRREKVQEKIETRKEKVVERMETRKEKMASREATLKQRLLTFKDKKKAERVDKINTNLNRINQKHTQQMMKRLDGMSVILTKLENRAGTTNTTAAKAAIETAKLAVASQAENDYTITVTSESKAKEEIKAIKDKLHADLKAANQTVIAAKQALGNAIRVSASSLGDKNGQ